jgi:hypothetical protein
MRKREAELAEIARRVPAPVVPTPEGDPAKATTGATTAAPGHNARPSSEVPVTKSEEGLTVAQLEERKRHGPRGRADTFSDPADDLAPTTVIPLPVVSGTRPESGARTAEAVAPVELGQTPGKEAEDSTETKKGDRRRARPSSSGGPSTEIARATEKPERVLEDIFAEEPRAKPGTPASVVAATDGNALVAAAGQQATAMPGSRHRGRAHAPADLEPLSALGKPEVAPVEKAQQ